MARVKNVKAFKVLGGVLLICLMLVCGAEAVDRSKFRKCGDTGFCRRYRGHVPKSHFHIDASSISLPGQDGSIMRAKIIGGPEGSIPLDLAIHFYANGVARMRVREPKTRWQPKEVILEENLAYASNVEVVQRSASDIELKYGDTGDQRVKLHLNPLRLEFFVNGEVAMTVNERNLFHFEHTRRRNGEVVTDDGVVSADEHAARQLGDAQPQAGDVVEPPAGKKIVDYNEHGHAIYDDGTTSADEKAAEVGEEVTKEGETPPPDVSEEEPSDGAWEESFGGHKDTKPFGPQSVGIDVTFNGMQHVYGIPEHATKFDLKSTTGSGAGYGEPYRLYNLDVFEYELDVPMALYGAIPLMVGHNKKRTVAAFWFNPTETFIDVEEGSQGKRTHWISEAGLADLFLMPGPNVRSLYAQYAEMTGTSQLPPTFSLGYHQCRWNYRDEADVKAVDSKFEELDFPYDVIWLDIEHTNSKKYFTWDHNLFPKPKEMIDEVASRGRKVVTIVDPHLKRDSSYRIHNEASAKGLYVRDK
eukprot:g81.t1